MLKENIRKKKNKGGKNQKKINTKQSHLQV
jgi:hypothetical protein